MRAEDFKVGYVPAYMREDVLSNTHTYAVVKHNSYGKPSEVLHTSDDKDDLHNLYCYDLYDDGRLIDRVTSIFGVKPKYEVVLLNDIVEGGVR